MPPCYPLPWRIALPLVWDALRAQPRSFQADARYAVERLSPPLKILNPENIPARGPALLLCNHYTRPGLPAWWIPLSISAAVPLEIHWMITNALTYLGPFTSLSRWGLGRIAQIYGFTAAPPMPPDQKDVEARAAAVRQILKVARSPQALIGLAPEGRDHPEGILGPLPPGAGRFIEQLATHCQPIVPTGVYEEDEALCLRFGAPLILTSTAGKSAEQRDQLVGQQVLSALAQQLPPHLCGDYF